MTIKTKLNISGVHQQENGLTTITNLYNGKLSGIKNKIAIGTCYIEVNIKILYAKCFPK